MNQDQIIKTFTDCQALLNGHFELRSGLHSNQYFQCALLLQHPRLTTALCTDLVAKLRSNGIVPTTVISPAIGGLFVGQELARLFDVNHIFAEKDANGRLVLRRNFQIRPEDTYLVAEDVITRGGRALETIELVRAKGGQVIGIAALVDRSNGTVQFPAPHISLVKLAPQIWEPAKCPLCAKGEPMNHPGS